MGIGQVFMLWGRKIPGWGAIHLTMLWLLCGFTTKARDHPGNWSGDYPPCDRRGEVVKQSHMNLGVRFSSSDSGLAVEFARALNFWATILDMEWYEENSRKCSIQVIDGYRQLFRHAEVARAQFPDRSAFQGWIAFNPKVALARSEQYLVAVHELGHVFGLPHNPSSWSVMYYLHLDGPAVFDSADLAALTARHKIRAARIDTPVIVMLQSRIGEDNLIFEK